MQLKSSFAYRTTQNGKTTERVEEFDLASGRLLSLKVNGEPQALALKN